MMIISPLHIILLILYTTVMLFLMTINIVILWY